MKNYQLVEKKYIDEISSNVTVYRHIKSGARVCTLENDDTNKVFSIAFRTPPINDCGLTHILEHSVLCGSKAFPVKDPFVELLKSSLNTFLNAFTFPDKTMYPCASQNDKDFKNLMHVYMDAVLYPQIYQHKEIFEQEGWHYHLENKEDPITINGVVYNEMKGAFSDPQQSLFSKIMLSLYPDTAYHYESGGDPKYIPELSYEVFKDFHSKFYHPSNSYIMIYGNCDMEERLEWLDNEYLSKFDKIDFDTRLEFQKPFLKPVSNTYEYPVEKGEDLSDSTFLSYNVVLPSTLDNKLMLAISLVVTALFDVPGAPIKQALIDANIGQDISAFFDDGLLQPLLGIVATNANSEDEERFIRVINENLEAIIKNGLDKDALLALINHAEFQARERGFSARSPLGLNIEMAMLSGWLYDEDAVYSKLELIEHYKSLKEELNTDYYENIIKDYILNNNHKSYVKLIPSEDCNDIKEKELEIKLNEYKQSLSDDELDLLIKETIHLSDYQNEKSSDEAIATLPKLSIEDINEEPENLKLEVIDGVLFSEYPTNDIAYVSLYFDISKLNKTDLLYAGLFTDLFKQMSTSKMTYKDINQTIQNSFGSLSCGISTERKCNTNECLLQLVFNYSALTNNINAASELLQELIFDTQFNDEKRLLEYLTEMKANLDMGVVQRGHQVAMRRALSYIDETSYKQEVYSGITYMDFISDIVANFNNKKDEVIKNLYGIINKLISKKNYTLGFTGSKEQLEALKPVFDSFYNGLQDNALFEKEEYVPYNANEAFTSAIDVNYVSRVGKFSDKYNAGLNVLQNAMSMDYLWMQVRVHGGAYGCMMSIIPGIIGFTSYRDPNISKTNDVYQNSYKFVEDLSLTEDDLLKFIIGAVGNSESVKHVRDKAQSARSLYFRGLDYETRKKNRHDLIHVTADEIKSFTNMFKEAMSEYNICCIGNTQKINESKDMFNIIRPLTK